MEPDEEAIPTGDDNSIGTPAPAAQATPAPQGDTGAIGDVPLPQGDNGAIAEGPIQQQQPPQGPQRFGPLGRIVSYLMGEGAVPPQVLQQGAEQIDPEGGMSASDRNLMVVADAAQRGGPDAAWKIVQANRVAYNAKQAFAYAALNGTQQKPPDLNAAVDAANQAADHVLDGSNAKFIAGQGGVTATVKGPDGNVQNFNLTPDQFRRYLNVGGDGQFDKQMQQGGIARTLTNITQNQQRVSSASNPPPLAGAPRQQQAPQQAQPETRLGAKVNGFGPAIDPDLGYSPQLQRRANAMFPPGASSDHDRQAWMAQQQGSEDALKNKVDVAEANAEGRQNVATTNAGARAKVAETQGATARDVAETKAKGWQYASDQKLKAAQAQIAQKIAHEENTNANASQTRALKLVQTKLMSAQPLTKEEQAMVDTLPGAAQQAQQVTKPGATQQQAPRAPVGQQQQAVPPAAQRVVNQVYTTPKGQFKWMGNGWQAVQ